MQKIKILNMLEYNGIRSVMQEIHYHQRRLMIQNAISNVDRINYFHVVVIGEIVSMK